MEKLLDENEKIRRAEEIYYRRNQQSATEMGKTNRGDLISNKLMFHLLVMINIAVLIFCIQNKNYVFSTDFLTMLDQYNNVLTDKIFEIFSFNNEVESNDLKDNSDEVNETSEIIPQASSTKIESNPEISTSSISEMDLDINNLNAAYEFSKPLAGIVSSTFGARESKLQNVTGYHTGIDIAADKGTKISAAMQGIVELVSSEGDYGKHIKIRCNNVTTLYAHCSKIYVKEGQIVGLGQEIAEVGNTGNSTGPHLHFEIRVDDRFVDPGRLIKF